MTRRYPLVQVNGQLRELAENDRIYNSGNVFRDANPPPAPVEGDLWFNTSNNTIRIFDGSTFINVIAGNTGATVDVGATAPGTVNNGLLWFDTANGLLMVYIAASSSWVSCGTEVFISTTTPAGGESGDVWYNPLTGAFSMYITGSINSWVQLGGLTSISDILAFG